jgi:HEAT repeat protein
MSTDRDSHELAAKLADPSPQARVQAIAGLITLGSAALPALLEVLAAHPDMNARWSAAYTLGLIADPAAVPALSAALDDHPYVAQSARRALSLIDTPEALAALEKRSVRPRPAVPGGQE